MMKKSISNKNSESTQRYKLNNPISEKQMKSPLKTPNTAISKKQMEKTSKKIPKTKLCKECGALNPIKSIFCEKCKALMYIHIKKEEQSDKRE